MIDFIPVLHFLLLALLFILPILGVSSGQSSLAKFFMEALDRQPSVGNHLNRMLILCMAFNETVAVICVFFGFLLIQQIPSTAIIIAEVGIVFATAASALYVSRMATLPAQSAFIAVARQPFTANSIINSMLLTQAMIQTPVLFGLIIALFIRAQFSDMHLVVEGVRALAAGFALFLGTLGPVYGLANFARSSCHAMGRNHNAQGSLQTFIFIGAGFIETPIIFAFIIALFIITRTLPTPPSLSGGIIYGAAAIIMGLGTLGAGIGSGATASKAAEYIGKKPELYGLLYRTSLVAQGIIDTASLWAFLIALILVTRT